MFWSRCSYSRLEQLHCRGVRIPPARETPPACWARTVPSALTLCCLEGLVCIFPADITALGLGRELGVYYSLASCKEKEAKTRKIKGGTFRRIPDQSRGHFGHGSWLLAQPTLKNFSSYSSSSSIFFFFFWASEKVTIALCPLHNAQLGKPKDVEQK